MIKQVHLLTVGLLVLLLGGPAAFPLNQAGMIVRQELLANLSSRIQSRRLPNGMNIVCMPAENTNEVTVGAFVLVGSADEDPTEHGLAHILEHMVFKGTKTRKEGHLDRLAARFGMRLGVDYNAITSHDATLYYFASDEKNWQVFCFQISLTLSLSPTFCFFFFLSFFLTLILYQNISLSLFSDACLKRFT